MATRKKVGLVLGSGSSRGWAHIGAIEALEAAGVPIDFVVGSSVGSYVGALYACGCLASLKEFVLRMDGKKVFSYFDVVFPRSGLLDGSRKVQELFSMHTGVADFSQLDIPVLMVATDLDRGEKVVLRSGSIMEALRATLCVPGLFAPVRVKGRWLVDGGLVDPVPVGVARAMDADVVIAVDLNGGKVRRRQPEPPRVPGVERGDDHPEYQNDLLRKFSEYYASAEASFKARIGDLFRKEHDTPHIIETVMSAINIMQKRITRINLAVEPPDILIQPDLGDLKMMDFDQVARSIDEGYHGVWERREEIQDLL